jgi:hypothetical protein
MSKIAHSVFFNLNRSKRSSPLGISQLHLVRRQRHAPPTQRDSFADLVLVYESLLLTRNKGIVFY